MPEKVATTALIAYADLEEALRNEGVWGAVEALAQEVRDTAYGWGAEEGWTRTAALIAYQDLEKALRQEGIWDAVEGLVERVRDTAYDWGAEERWNRCAEQLQVPTGRRRRR